MLINKLLTSCSTIDTIYLLVRNKKGKEVHSRVEDIFDDPVSILALNLDGTHYNTFQNIFYFVQIFDIMKRKVPKYRRKVQGIAGDCMLPGLGITSADKAILVKNVRMNAQAHLVPHQITIKSIALFYRFTLYFTWRPPFVSTKN